MVSYKLQGQLGWPPDSFPSLPYVILDSLSHVMTSYESQNEICRRKLTSSYYSSLVAKSSTMAD